MIINKIQENFIDYRLNRLLESINDNNLNENIIEDIKKAVSNIDKLKLFYTLIIMHCATWGYHNIDKNLLKNNIINNKKEIVTNLDKDNILSYAKTYVHDIFFDKDTKIVHKRKDPIFYNVENMHTSKNGKNFIKHHENKRNKVYDIKDGKLTVGYGHAEKKSKTKLKVGQILSDEEIDDLFNKDIKIAEDGIKRLFKEWKESGNEIILTQNMFDALVSIAFNSGVQGVRNSDFIKNIKEKKFKTASKNIEKHALRKGFPGLEKRRNQESKLFKKGL